MTESPIFIAGTGRSGTTLLRRILKRHPDVFAAARESRFIVDPDGIITLVDALSTNWSPAASDKALRRFEAMMSSLRVQTPLYRTMRTVSRRTGRNLFYWFSAEEYAHNNYGEQLGLEHYDATVKAFVEALEEFRFRGWRGDTKAFQFQPHVRLGKRFTRHEMLRMSATFIQKLYAHGLERENAARFCDDTPMNLLYAKFLHELFPESIIVHIFRDPRDVISSYSTQIWSSDEIALCTKQVKGLLEKWQEQRESLPAGSFIEIKFEDLIGDPEGTLTNLCNFAGLEMHPSLLSMDLSRHHIGRHRRDLSDEEIRYVECELNGWMVEKGYLLGDESFVQAARLSRDASLLD